MNKLRCTISSLLHREYMMLPAKDTDTAIAVNESLTDNTIDTSSDDRAQFHKFQRLFSRYFSRETYVCSVLFVSVVSKAESLPWSHLLNIPQQISRLSDFQPFCFFAPRTVRHAQQAVDRIYRSQPSGHNRCLHLHRRGDGSAE